LRIISRLPVILLLATVAPGQAIHGRGGITLPPPPAVEAVPVTDDYFGTKIQDNYRWLEDANSPETKAFIDDENAYTQRYMEQARIRPQIADDLDRAGACDDLEGAHRARERSVFREAAGRRGSGIDLRAPRLDGEGQAACRSGAVQPRSQYVSRTWRTCRATEHWWRTGARGRLGRNHGARIQCEDRKGDGG
jgi:hypothetical protein